MDESEKRRQLKVYFFHFEKPEKPQKSSDTQKLIAYGILIFLVGCFLLSVERVGLMLGPLGVFFGGAMIYAGISQRSKDKRKEAEYRESLKEYQEGLENWGLTESDLEQTPSGQQVDNWLREDLESIREHALNEELGLVREELKRDPLVIYGPLFWETYGIPVDELAYVREEPSDILRFSCYRVVCVFLTDARVATYSCDFNFLRNARVGEKVVEYLYRDIVSVSTEEISTNYTLPDGKTLQHAKVFRLAVASGDSIQVVVSSPQLKDMLNGTPNVENQDENVRVIREMLRTKKG